MNPIWAMLHNIITGRYHPILFYESPLPSYEPGDVVRHKSKGHHTAGFDTRAEALAFITERNYGRLALDKDFPWDEENDPMPAMVVFFMENSEGKLEPAF